MLNGCSLCGLLSSLHICVSHPQWVTDLTWGTHGQAASCSKETDMFSNAKTTDTKRSRFCHVMQAFEITKFNTNWQDIALQILATNCSG